jgi:hypothetical protein
MFLFTITATAYLLDIKEYYKCLNIIVDTEIALKFFEEKMKNYVLIVLQMELL